MPNTANIAVATMGCGTALPMPDASLVAKAASHAKKPPSSTVTSSDLSFKVASHADKAKTSLDPGTVNEIRARIATMGPGTATGVPVRLTGYAAGVMPKGRASSDIDSSVSVSVAPKAGKPSAQVVAGYGEMDRCDVTVTDALVLDVTLDDVLVLDVTIS